MADISSPGAPHAHGPPARLRRRPDL